MARPRKVRRHKRRTPVGAPPGTLIVDPQSTRTTISVFTYDGSRMVEEADVGVDAISGLQGDLPVTWIDVQGLGDLEAIRSLGENFALHHLAMEDVLNLHQRSKVEEYDDYLFIVTRMPADTPRSETEQISMFLGHDFVLTFQERPGDVFDPIRSRIRNHKGRIRTSGPDYLAYALIDAAIDNYFPILERCGEALEQLEDRVVAKAEPVLVGEIHNMKRDLLELRRAIWPQREMLNSLIRSDSDLVTDTTKLYLRDCYDHTIQLMDMVETDREIALGLVDVYLSSLSNRMNEIMKVLTIFATVFMPLSFIAGFYGMNFDRDASPWNMPELGWYYGYPAAIAMMAIVAVVLIAYFRRRGWVGRES
jgi:magnesium transporter